MGDVGHAVIFLLLAVLSWHHRGKPGGNESLRFLLYSYSVMLLRFLVFGLFFALAAAPSVTRAQQSLLSGPADRRVDILSGEPIGPRTHSPRLQPETLNGPLRPAGRRVEGPPLEVYAVPQIGTQYGTQTVPAYGAQLRSQYDNQVKPQYGSQYRSPYGAPYGGPSAAQRGGYAAGLLPR